MALTIMTQDEVEVRISIGDWVYFKSDRECSGRVVRIRGSWLDLEACEAESNYGQTTTTIHATKIWKEE